MSFIRVAAAAPRVILGNCQKNAESIQTLAEMLEGSGVQAAVFPELCLTGATCQDLYWQPDFQRQAVEALLTLAKRTGDMIVMVGLPLTFGGKMYNCAAVLQKGRILGIVPKASVACGGPQGSIVHRTVRTLPPVQNRVEALALGILRVRLARGIVEVELGPIELVGAVRKQSVDNRVRIKPPKLGSFVHRLFITFCFKFTLFS